MSLGNSKFKDFKCYGALESLFDGARRYRRVFDETEACYINAELTLYNRLFDQQDWQINLTFRAVEYHSGREICKIDKTMQVSKDTHLIILRDGWGTPNPGFWKKGSYKWEALIDGKVIGETHFYVTNNGIVTPSRNPYFNIKAVKLFEGPYEGVPKEKRIYLQSFDTAKTRYVNIEMVLDNLLTNVEHLPLEFHVYIHNDRNYLKAYTTYFLNVYDKRKEIIFDTGYGTREPGFWVRGNYTLHMVFMDRIIASIPFVVGDQSLQNNDSLPYTVPGNETAGTGNLFVPFNTTPPPVEKQALKTRYKVKEMKPYGSLESLFQGMRKYRCVFEESETTYLNAELSFYNILFNEEDWETTVTLRAVSVAGNQEICKFEKKVNVTQDLNVVYVRDGWGTPDPGFWKQGKYKWEAYIDNQLISETVFYVVNNGLVTSDNNPYFHIQVIRLFESPFEGTPLLNRKYLSTFNSETTRYINVELTLENKLFNLDIVPIELQVSIYNDLHQLKAYVTLFKEITDHATTCLLDTGYGTREAGFWYKDNYTLEVMFMDQIVAVIPFEVGTEDIALEGEYDLDNREWQTSSAENKPMTYAEAKAELDAMIGLETVKEQIDELATYINYIKLAESKGKKSKEKQNLHVVFTGNPGTGKTTVARLLGNIYRALGVLSNGKVHEVGRAELVGEYIGQTAPKVKKLIEQAKGGILFIDEAYALSNRGEDEKDFGREVIEVLIKEMSDGKADLAVICAGYTKEMQHFLTSNPGLASRFWQVIDFPDYTPDELMKIADYTAEKIDVTLHPEAQRALQVETVEAYRNRDRNFGNARYLNGIMLEAKKNMALRLMKNPSPNDLSLEELETITLPDVEKVFGKKRPKGIKMPIDERLLQESIAELNQLIGLNNIKNEVNEQVKLARYYLDMGRDLRNLLSVHAVFSGNPGTGKTSVARILSQIYKALGILDRGHLVECDRRALVAGFVGQTAMKTSTVLDTAIGGCLFIDEAYALTPGTTNDFGHEAVETILKRMEDDRGKFMVIVAGYTKEMQQFLEANPGLRSRFDKYFYFQDYTEAELLQIAESLFAAEQVNMDASARTVLQRHLSALLRNKTKYFGNGRTVRKIVEETLRRQHLRLAETPPERRTPETIATIIADDLNHLRNAVTGDEEKRIGF